VKRKEAIEQFVSNFKEIYGINNFCHNDKDPKKVYYSGPVFGEEETVAMIESILTSKWLSAGAAVNQFEHMLAKKYNQKYSIMLNSGSSANLVLINALKILFKWDNNSEIILSVVGFPTTLAPIIQNNLKPVFIDIEMDTLNFDISLIEKKINKNTKAIVISPVLGNPPNMDEITKIATEYNLHIILDNCDSLGSRWDDKYLSDYAIASSYSFYPAHHITTGEGGAITTNNQELIKIARSLINWGRACTCIGEENLGKDGSCGKRFSKWLDGYDKIVDHRYVFSNIGYNLKPLNLQGAIGIEQLKKVDDFFIKRRIAKFIIGRLFTDNIYGVRIPEENREAYISWFGTPVICDNNEIKTKLVQHLENNDIQTRNYFAGNILIHPGFKHLGNYNDYPIANEVLDRVFFVGASPQYDSNTFQHIKRVLKAFKNGN